MCVRVLHGLLNKSKPNKINEGALPLLAPAYNPLVRENC
jgi:hypothetical protein